MWSGDQYPIEAAGYRAVITESGGALRELSHEGLPLIDGFGDDEMSPGGRGQLLMPWPNRIRDGRYSFGDIDHQLPLTEPKRHNASHGLARWVAWTPQEHTPSSVSLTYRLMAQSGYPWTLDLHVVYDLSADGLTVTQTATNLSGSTAPYACGAHPYFTVGDSAVDSWELTLPAATRALSDPDRLLPIGREEVDGTGFDFRMARPIRQTRFNDAFTDLDRDAQGRATTLLRDPASGRAVALWVDPGLRWLQVYTADDVAGGRRAVAVEPMTANADAFNSTEDLELLGPAGSEGAELSVSWGVRAVQ